ncbi:hypothetical protein ID866_2351 [Astraeus odoratus]|nr:hypothetical protein ID866_2351 [Astraeus odoratus]
MLQTALSEPYPRDRPGAPPLQFNLEVVESTPPTPDQLKTILSYLTPGGSEKTRPPSYSTFLSAHPGAAELSEQPHTAAAISSVAARYPSALRWPVVVDWNGGRACVGDVECVKGILEALRQRRDGEVKEDDV